MFSFLQHFEPQALALSFGWINIYWYGLFLVLAIIAALFIANLFWKKQGLEQDLFYDLSFWVIIGGIAGARIYEWFLNYHYYLLYPGELLKIWHGGLAIHGAIIGGFLALLIFTKKNQLNTTEMIALIIPGLALGQSIGRFGNYFNQELFGKPTNLPWGIFISPANRPLIYQAESYFHPTFLYESLLCLLLFIFLFAFKKNNKINNYFIIGSYFIGYALIRFFLEFIKIDYTPELFGIRWPQIISLFLFILGASLIYLSFYKASHAKITKRK